MNFCPHCGNRIEGQPTFCPNCGQRLATATTATTPAPPADDATAPGATHPGATTAPDVATRPTPTASITPDETAATPPSHRAMPQAAPSRPVLPPTAEPGNIAATSADPWSVLSKVITGNWVGATGVAATAVAIGWPLAIIHATFQLRDRGHLSGILTDGTNLFFSSFGVPLDLHGHGTTGTLMSAPLLVTILAAAAAIFVFNRVVAGYPDKLAAIGDGIRAGVVLAVIMTIAMVVMRIIDPSTAAMGDKSGFSPGMLTADTKTIPSVPGTIFIPGFAFAVLLCGAVLRSTLPARHQVTATLSRIATPAIHAIRTIIWCTLPAGLVLVISGETSSDATHSLRSFAGDVFGLPNYGTWTLGAGLGAPFGYRASQVRDEVYRLHGLSDQLNWVVWLAIPAAIATICLAAYIMARTTTHTDALLSSAAYLAALLAVLPLLGLMANTLAHYTSTDFDATLRVGIDLTELTFTFWGASILATIAALLLTKKLTLTHLQTRPG